jgi:hypothetical protein
VDVYKISNLITLFSSFITEAPQLLKNVMLTLLTAKGIDTKIKWSGGTRDEE